MAWLLITWNLRVSNLRDQVSGSSSFQHIHISLITFNNLHLFMNINTDRLDTFSNRGSKIKIFSSLPRVFLKLLTLFWRKKGEKNGFINSLKILIINWIFPISYLLKHMFVPSFWYILIELDCLSARHCRPAKGR